MRRVASLPLIGLLLGFVLLAGPPRAVADAQLPDGRSQPEFTGTGRLAVTVVAADSGAPVRQVLVTLFGTVLPAAPTAVAPVASASLSGTAIQGGVVLSRPSAPPRDAPGQIRREAQTDEQGRLEFMSLPRGQYSLSVAPPSPFVRPRATRSTVLGDGEAGSLVVSLLRGGVITGRLLDEAGDPVVGASVFALTGRKTSAGRRPVGRSASTDDRGHYRLFDLPSGEYLVLATYRADRIRPSASEEPRSGPVPTYYPGTSAPDEARPIAVQFGQEIGSVDFALAQARLGRLQVSVADSRGTPAPRNTSVALAERGSVFGPTSVHGRGMADGTFVFDAVPIGDYLLTAQVPRTDGQPGYGEGTYIPVRVEGQDQQIDVRTNGGATLSGRIRWEGSPTDAAAPTPRPGGVSVSLSQAPTISFATTPGRGVVADDGTFRVTGVRGPLTIRIGTPVGVVKSIRRGAVDLLGSALELTGTEDLDDIEVVLTTETGSLAGTVVDARGEPVPGAALVVFGEDSKYWFLGSPFVRPAPSMTRELLASRPSPVPSPPAAGPGGRRSDEASAIPRSPGRFAFLRLLPGRYYVATLPQTEGNAFDIEWLDREGLTQLRDKATIATVVAGEVTEMVVRLDK